MRLRLDCAGDEDCMTVNRLPVVVKDVHSLGGRRNRNKASSEEFEDIYGDNQQ